MAALEHTASMLGKIAGYIEILSRDPRSTVFVSLAEAYRQMGLLDDAIEVARNGVQTLPRFSPGYTTLGRIHAQRGELPEADAAFSRANEIDPANVPALKGLARVCGMKGDKTRARTLLEQALRLQPDDATIGKMLAALAIPTSEKLSAVAETKPIPGGEVAETSEYDDRQAPIATATIAEIYVKQGLLAKALQVYRDLLKANPGSASLEARYQELDRQLYGEPVPDAEVQTQTRKVDDAFPVSAERGEERVLATLTRWLDAIRDRRDDVR